MTGFIPARRVNAVRAYAVPGPRGPIDLDLTAARSFAADDSASGASGANVARRYPDVRPLTAIVAAEFGVTPDRLLITAGADDALDRICRVALEDGCAALITDPTFEMIPRYVALAGGEARCVAWPAGPLPVGRLVEASHADTSLALVASPNNPTGAVATADEFRRLHDALPGAIVVADLAYVDFADVDPTRELLELPRVVVLRTMSKGWAMPGLRVGFAIGPADVISWMKRVGGPFPVSAESLAAAERALGGPRSQLRATVRSVRAARTELEAALHKLGAVTTGSQANFVTAQGPRAAWLRDALASLGVATRYFAGDPDRLRITVPAAAADVQRLRAALETALGPEALLFDLDGVIADVSESYREAIRQTAARFGVSVSRGDIAAAKAKGNSSDDWQLTASLIRAAGRDADLGEVTAEFERLYQGSAGTPGLQERERLTVSAGWLLQLGGRLPLAVVTGRPRADAERFLSAQGVRGAFSAIVAREDAPLKPAPDPVRLALSRLGVERAWMLGDTPDDIVAARMAGVVSVGVTLESSAGDAPTMHDALTVAGAARVITSPTEITTWLP